ncbi:hypothetical protein L9F63_020138 [Diploptera punctata]|uniref:WD repeat-containing protein 76 n=1 Tax=Diploptera punctata TaxID=6984 RepID=A0AAD8EDV4_DIPPU|nr:hypothetical protein L9F63_020138 [Diploptera punctata]
MWHEARKQERKIRGIMVDYKKRAERRRDFYEKIKADPTQFLQLHGRPVKIHLDPAVAMAGDSPANMMPWQGRQDVLIDRFDVRAHLDYIPENPVQPETVPNEELSREDRLANYERYRIIVQNDFLGIGEEKFLHQLYIEEQFGPVTRTNEVDKKKRDKGVTGAAIPYSYDDSVSGQGGAGENDDNAEGEDEKEEEEEDDDDDDDSDIDFDFERYRRQPDIGPQQAHEMNMCGAAYGMSGNDFFTFLTRDIEEKESLRLAREQEEEKAMYSGRKSRRERRAFREKRLQGRKISPPSYAARTSPTYDPYRKSASKSRSRSRSHSPINSGQITYITSFGGEEESADEGARVGTSTSKLPSSSSHSANVVVAPQSKASRSGSPGSKNSSRSRSGRNSSPHRGHGSRKSSSRWSPDTSHRDHVSSRAKARSRSPHHSRNRSSSRTRSRHRRSNSSNSSIRSHSPGVKAKPRSRSKTPHNQPPPPPVRRYYGSRRGASSSSELDDSDSESTKQSSSPVPRNSKPLPHKTLSSGFGNSGAGTKSQPKLTPQERLKKKMQALLNRQYKADKRAERIRHEKQEQERQDREDELREMAIKLRRRERERRHRMQDDDEEYEEEERGSSPSSHSSHSPSSSPPPGSTSSRSGHRRNRCRDRRSRRGRSSDRQDQHNRSRSRSPHQRPRHRPLITSCAEMDDSSEFSDSSDGQIVSENKYSGYSKSRIDDLKKSELSEYELIRQKNIEERKRLFRELDIQKTVQNIKTIGNAEKKQKSATKRSRKSSPPPLRTKSLRLQNKSPSGDLLPEKKQPENNALVFFQSCISEKSNCPLGMAEAMRNKDDVDDVKTFMESFEPDLKKEERSSPKSKLSGDLQNLAKKFSKLTLTADHVVKVLPFRIYSLAVHPSETTTLLAVGDKWGHLGLWNMQAKGKESITVFEPHVGPVNCTSFCVNNPTKIYTTSHDGTVRCCDMNKLVFDEVYSSDQDMRNSHTTWHCQTDEASFLVAHGTGDVALVDTRTPNKVEGWYSCHERSVRTVQLHPLENQYFITSSALCEVKIWDRRYINKKSAQPVCSLSHPKGLTSAFFSPSAKYVLTTCNDDRLRVYDVREMKTTIPRIVANIKHNNHTGRWLTTFKATWHPQRDDLFVVGSMERPRRIALYSSEGKIVHNLKDENLASVCSICVFHPTQDIVFGGNSSGRVHVFM